MDPSPTPPRNAPWNKSPIRLGAYELPIRQVDLGDVLAAEKEGDESPWWAHVWPAGVALATRILEGPRLDGIDCLDLGTGSGVVGIALGLKGANVTFADNLASSLTLAAENARQCGLEKFETLLMDWDTPPRRRYTRVYGADILYVPEHIPGVIGAFSSMVADGGLGYLADPRRQSMVRLFSIAKDAGLRTTHEVDTPEMMILRIERSVAPYVPNGLH